MTVPRRSSNLGRALGHCCLVVTFPIFIIVGLWIGRAIERSERERR